MKVERTLHALLAVVVVASPSAARAEMESNPSIAEALFREARQAMRANDYATACPKLAESERLDPSAGTLLNLAVCEEHLGHTATAWTDYRGALDMLPPGDDRVALARGGLAALDARVPWLTIVPSVSRAKVDLTVDQTPIAAASVGVALPIDPGEHAIEARAPNGARVVRFTLAEGERRALALDLSWAGEEPPAPEPAAAPTIAVPKKGHGRRTAAYAIGAAGVASLVASGVFGVLVLTRKSTVAAHCTNKECDPTGATAAREGATFDALATTTFAGGLVALGGSAVLVLTAPPSPSSPSSPSPARAAWGPMLSVTGVF